MIEWCEHTGLPLHMMLTKADKLNYGAAKNTLLQVQKELKDNSFPLTIQLFSALKKTGIDEVHAALDRLFNPAEQDTLPELSPISEATGGDSTE
jgi:GTP-binding protein